MREVYGNLFGLFEDPGPNIHVFPHFEYDAIPLDDGAPKTAVDHLLTEIGPRLPTMGTVEGSNEASRSEYIFSFLVTAASIFQDIIISPQKQLSGTYGRGPVDFALKANASSVILGVAQVKRDDIDKGIAQNVVQLLSSLSPGSSQKRGYTNVTNEIPPSA